MSLPEQVRRQAERANELLNQANGTPGNPADAPAPALEPTPEDPPAQAPAPAPAPEPTPAAPADPAPAPTPAPPASPDWEQKYRTLQGVLSAEQRKWREEKAALEARVAAAATPPAPAAPSPAPTPAPVSQADLDTYGPELMDMVRRQAAEMAGQIVAEKMAALQPVLDKTTEQVTQVASHVYRSEGEKFYGELASAVPDWQTINEDPRWLAWLGEVDQLSGVARQVYLDNASQNLDHERAARLFNAFKEHAGLTKPASAPAPAPVAAPAPALSPTPRTVGNASAPTHREPQAGVKRSEIAAHYSRGARDVSYRNSPEHAAFEQRLQQATASNQIIEA